MISLRMWFPQKTSLLRLSPWLCSCSKHDYKFYQLMISLMIQGGEANQLYYVIIFISQSKQEQVLHLKLNK